MLSPPLPFLEKDPLAGIGSATLMDPSERGGVASSVGVDNEGGVMRGNEG